MSEESLEMLPAFYAPGGARGWPFVGGWSGFGAEKMSKTVPEMSGREYNWPGSQKGDPGSYTFGVRVDLRVNRLV